MAFDNEHIRIEENGRYLEVWGALEPAPRGGTTGVLLMVLDRDAADAFGRRLRQLGGGNFDLEEAFMAGFRAASQYDWERIGDFEDFGPKARAEIYRAWLREEL